MGLGGIKRAWQRQTKYFGHENGDKYSVLLIDNRGAGESDKPLSRYSTSEMARDLLEVLDHVEWTEQRQVHAVGISMGGMILQELACLIPTRLSTLILLCTAAAIDNNKSWSESVAYRMSFLMPRSVEDTIDGTLKRLFPIEWLIAPDGSKLPSPKTTPRCGSAKDTEDGEYLHFQNNYQRIQAQEIAKRRDPAFTPKGFLCQLVAAGWHNKSPEQLGKMADELGRERITVFHGTSDNMIDVQHGRKLIQYIQPGEGLIKEGVGHAPIAEIEAWFNQWLNERIEAGEKLG
jgi:pimeloyl-ACP methyl ester carboxylesterase